MTVSYIFFIFVLTFFFLYITIYVYIVRGIIMAVKVNSNMDITAFSYYNNPGTQAKRLPFFIESTGHMCTYKNYYTIREKLDNYLFIYTMRGRGYIEYKGFKHRLLKNDCLIIDCNEYQHYKTDGELWEFSWMHINGKSAREYYNMINKGSFNIVNVEKDADILRAFSEIFVLLGNIHMAAEIKISLLITEILTNVILSKASELYNHVKYKNYIDMAASFISEKFSENISVDDIISDIPVSKYHFLRIFKEYSGISLYQYLQSHRINLSKKLLKETDTSVNEIVSLIGYSDVNNYIKAFKKSVGTTPSDYRKHWSI